MEKASRTELFLSVRRGAYLTKLFKHASLCALPSECKTTGCGKMRALIEHRALHERDSVVKMLPKRLEVGGVARFMLFPDMSRGTTNHQCTKCTDVEMYKHHAEFLDAHPFRIIDPDDSEGK